MLNGRSTRHWPIEEKREPAMSPLGWIGVLGGLGVSVILGLAVRAVRRRALHRWFVPYARQALTRRCPVAGRPVHVLLCIADHYEPKRGQVPSDIARARVQRWLDDYPRRLGHFRDSDGRPPRHTFFYPLDEYEPQYLDMLAFLCRAGFGEVEIHLHHDGDTADTLREQLERFRDLLFRRHGLLATDSTTGRTAYGFVHGNWALNNCHPTGRHCGVNNELAVLRETGCYADFTYPSAPHATQPPKINSIYYACSDSKRAAAHNRGVDVGGRKPPTRALMLVQGPLWLDWRSVRAGRPPRIENACLQGSQPPSMSRLILWLRASIQVPSRPDWFFVKLHTHGAEEKNMNVLLGDAMSSFHEALASRARDEPGFHYHYVTAREMYNLARAAETGWRGSVAEARDHELVWNGGVAGARKCPGGEPRYIIP